MTKSEIEASQRIALIDEYGDLHKKLAPYKQDLARVQELAKAIRSWYENEDANKSHLALGNRYIVTLGVKSLQTLMLPMKDIAKALGRKAFMLAVSITVKALEANAPPAVVASLTTKVRAGSRDLLVSEIPESEPAALAA